MNGTDKISFDQQVYYRLISLWVLCEAFLGGIIHGLKIPVSGLVVGSGAIICICLIAYYVPVKGAIIKATIIVAIFKMMLSPHTPPTAYIAVFFQGAIGQLLFINQKFFRISCIILGLLAMVESAIQRILVLFILYGTQFWNAVDQYISRLTNDDDVSSYSQMIAIGYILLHAVAGILVGWFAGRLAVMSKNWNMQEKFIIDDKEDSTLTRPAKPSKRKRIFKLSLFVVWVFLLIIFLQSVAGIGTPILPSNIALQILLRSLLIVLTWYFFLGPLVLSLMKKWLEKQKHKKQSDIQQIMLLLPSTKHLVIMSWQRAEGDSRWQRIKSFLEIVLINSLQNKNAK